MHARTHARMYSICICVHAHVERILALLWLMVMVVMMVMMVMVMVMVMTIMMMVMMMCLLHCLHCRFHIFPTLLDAVVAVVPVLWSARPWLHNVSVSPVRWLGGWGCCVGCRRDDSV